MISIKQHYYSDDDPRTQDFYKVHYFSETGHFEYKSGALKGKACGWHLELGTSSRITKYVEIDDGETHDVPISLEDMIIHIEPEEQGDDGTEERSDDGTEEQEVTNDESDANNRV